MKNHYKLKPLQIMIWNGNHYKLKLLQNCGLKYKWRYGLYDEESLLKPSLQNIISQIQTWWGTNEWQASYFDTLFIKELVFKPNTFEKGEL